MALSIVNSASNTQSGSNNSVFNLGFTVAVNDIVVFAHSLSTNQGATLMSMSGASSTAFTLAKSLAFNAGNFLMEVWWARVTAGSASPSISITTSGVVQDAWSQAAVVIRGADASPQDPNASIPATNTGSSGTPGSTISTTNANNVIIGVAGDNSTTVFTAGSGFTLQQTTNVTGTSLSVSIGLQTKIVSATISSTNQPFGAADTNQWGVITDAVGFAITATPQHNLYQFQHKTDRTYIGQQQDYQTGSPVSLLTAPQTPLYPKHPEPTLIRTDKYYLYEPQHNLGQQIVGSLMTGQTWICR